MHFLWWERMVYKLERECEVTKETAKKYEDLKTHIATKYSNKILQE